MSPSEQSLLITGAAGRIGRLAIQGFADRYKLSLLDIHPFQPRRGLHLFRADICRLNEISPYFHHGDTVVHLAAEANPKAAWESIASRNITGTLNVLQAASSAGCRRVIFASSVQVVIGYPRDMRVDAHMPIRPANAYGISKAWGEMLARHYSQEKGISIICLRIGWYFPPRSLSMVPGNPGLAIGISGDDLLQLMDCAVTAPQDLRFGIFHGTSNNRQQRFDIQETCQVLGYHPQDDIYNLAEHNYIGRFHRLVKTHLRHW